jgi:hypothetical protein
MVDRVDLSFSQLKKFKQGKYVRLVGQARFSNHPYLYHRICAYHLAYPPAQVSIGGLGKFVIPAGPMPLGEPLYVNLCFLEVEKEEGCRGTVDRVALSTRGFSCVVEPQKAFLPVSSLICGMNLICLPACFLLFSLA